MNCVLRLQTPEHNHNQLHRRLSDHRVLSSPKHIWYYSILHHFHLSPHPRRLKPRFVSKRQDLLQTRQSRVPHSDHRGGTAVLIPHTSLYHAPLAITTRTRGALYVCSVVLDDDGRVVTKGTGGMMETRKLRRASCVVCYRKHPPPRRSQRTDHSRRTHLERGLPSQTIAQRQARRPLDGYYGLYLLDHWFCQRWPEEAEDKWSGGCRMAVGIITGNVKTYK
ncbi:hypothetical protein BKA70DRAFT_181263 [Coprinopsis sp. MPI-PUGE-AT-0042]|nr:hypothetical protein BKA70DRAFT_181263 [Coprinopsis sp. MPI-PUGE-AT-0042]